MSYHTEFISTGCNREVESLDWNVNYNLIAYGSSSTIAIYHPEKTKIHTTLRGHDIQVNDGKVTCVKWLTKSDSNIQELVSGSTDTQIIGHTGSIVSISVLQTNDKTYILSSSIDNTVKLWSRLNNETNWICEDTLSLHPTKSCITTSLISMQINGKDAILLALGGVDCKISIYYVTPKLLFLLALEGHQDWIRSLSFVNVKDEVLLASSAQDSLIRIWKFSTSFLVNNAISNNSVKVSSTHSDCDISTTSLGSRGSLVSIMHNSNHLQFSIIFDAMLVGHEDWVFSVSWHPKIKDQDDSLFQPPCLLSCSMDKTMMIWRPEKETSLWLNDVRVGEVGGHTLGLFGCKFGPEGRSILAHGYNGALHLWKNNDSKIDDSMWLPTPTISGHFSGVQDLTWDSKSNYLLSVSSDQTSRIFSNSPSLGYWFELARPQTHGYDLTTVCAVPNVDHRFSSGAAEKVVRVFDATSSFIESLSNLSSVKSLSDEFNRALKATVPELGLSNKGTFAGETALPERSGFEIVINNYDDEFGAAEESNKLNSNAGPVNLVLESPPSEEFLIEHSLFPETEKLYGHPYEILAIASNFAGTRLVASCVAKQAEHATLIMWDTKNWKECKRLGGHTLSVAQLKFSHSDKFLLSVSRDRSFCLFKQNEAMNYELFSVSDKAHGRIIWSGDWAHDDSIFATGSRDKKVRIWRTPTDNSNKISCDSTLPLFENGVTSVSFAPRLSNGAYIIGVGLEDGSIQVYKGLPGSNSLSWSLLVEIGDGFRHDNVVKKLCWRLNNNILQLASCSLDHSVRLYNFDF